MHTHPANLSSPLWRAAEFIKLLPRSYDLKQGTLKDRLCVARPTAFLGVPLVWEKIADRMRALGAKNKGMKKA